MSEASQIRLNLTAAQRLVWLGQRLNPDTPLYNMALRFDLPPDLDVARFSTAWEALSAECEVLRFGLDDNVVNPALVDVGASPTTIHRDVSQAEVDELVSAAVIKPFGSMENLTRSLLVRLSDSTWQWILVQHHLVTDLASFFIIQKHLASLYADPSGNCALGSFTDYAQRENELSRSDAIVNARAAILDSTSGCSPAVNFYETNVRVPTSNNSRRTFEFSATGKHRSQPTGFGEDLQDYFDFLTALTVVLARSSGLSKVVIGVPLHNRTNVARQNTPGMLVEILPLAVEISSELSIAELRQKVVSAFGKLMQAGSTGLVDEALAKTFDVVLNYLQVPELQFDGAAIQAHWIHCNAADPGHALRIHVWRTANDKNSRLILDCRDDTFNESRAQSISDQLCHMLQTLKDVGDTSIANVRLIDDTQRSQIMARACGATAPVQFAGGIAARIHASAERLPTQPALVDREREVSFSNLLDRAQQRAADLQACGPRDQVFALIWRDRSIDAVVDIVAAMLAGVVFVPVEASTPTGRVTEIVTDLHARGGTVVAMTDPDLADAAAKLGAKALTQATQSFIKPQIDPQDLCYVLFTSGSTGFPKGVAITHGAIHDYISWAEKTYAVTGADKFGLFTSLGFDLTLTSLLLPLVVGASLRIFPATQGAADLAVKDAAADRSLTFLKLTPSHLGFWSDADLESSNARCWVVGGEQFMVEQAERITRAKPQARIYNEYGPTEATVACMVHRYTAADREGSAVPIGLPADNHSIHILDEFGHPVADEIAGEIHIGGAGLAAEYLNRPEETAERFVKIANIDELLYRTGDIARWNSRGVVEYLGRRDSQVKVSGIRFELSELDNLLGRHPDVAQAASVLCPTSPTAEPSLHCQKCGLPDNYPEVQFSADGICSVCQRFAEVHDDVMQWFGSTNQLRDLVDELKTSASNGKPDCAVLFSGGKDSTYMVYQLVQMGLNPVALSLDNGYLSQSAHDNIRRVVQHLGIAHEYLRTDDMNRIFADSLERFSNVCHGCFKTIYTLSMQYADRHGISVVFTGLSRGQLFETRLDDLFHRPELPVKRYDEMIMTARKAYHRMDDVVGRCLNNGYFDDDDCFDRVKFIDFYRYVDVPLDEVYEVLNTRVPWTRPSDTGRSTNCLINDTGIFVHRQEQGYHNYALPYAWDVRLGHKTRDQAIDELRDRIDTREVAQILGEVGYTRAISGAQQLASAVVPKSGAIDEQALRQWLTSHLPSALIPRNISIRNSLPLNANGKIDTPELIKELSTLDVAEKLPPAGDDEIALARCWQQALGRNIPLSRHDNFFAVGGDSMASILLVDEVRQIGRDLSLEAVFDSPVLTDMAARMTTANLVADDDFDFGLELDAAEVEQVTNRESPK